MKPVLTTILAAATAVLAASQVPLTDGRSGIAHSDGETVGAYRVFQSEQSPAHSIRVRPQDDTLCDARVAQFTGWLDVGRKHLFFWYFESRSAPASDPLVLWQTGGPGGSSMLGMLEELGPCLINDNGTGTVHNAFGWNKEANLLFVDQPAGVGMSYLDEGEPVPGTSFTAAADMHVFLQIFTSQVFPELLDRDFHITGESYGGHYEPVLGAEILIKNSMYPTQTQVRLKSILVGNGYFSPLYTAYGYWETLCTTNPGVAEPVFNVTRCDIMAANLPRCQKLRRICYSNPDPAICAAAEEFCWDGVVVHYDGESYAGGRNRFDITAPCVVDDVCYAEVTAIQAYLNLKTVRAALGVPASVGNYSVISDAVSQAFDLTADIAISTESQVLFLLDQGVNVLVYQGNLDLACNTAGNLMWASDMVWKGQPAFTSQSLQPWHSGGKAVGTFKEVFIQVGDNDHKTRFTFLTVDGAGHMVPQDKPSEAVDMMTKWLRGETYA